MIWSLSAETSIHKATSGTAVGSVAHSSVWAYAISLVMILLANTLPGLLPGRKEIFYPILVLLSVSVVALQWKDTPLPKRSVQRWVTWAVLVAGVYSLIVFITGDGYGRYGGSAFLFFGICPLLLLLLVRNKLIDTYARAFVNVLALLAVLSMALWVLGPILGILSPNCDIRNTWNGLGVELRSEGFFHLLYVVQSVDILGFSTVRNTGIFAEAPMYSFVLCVGILLEWYLAERPRITVICLLSLCVITTFSTTGIIFLIAFCALECLSSVYQSGSRLRMVIMLLLVLAFFVVADLAMLLIDDKLATRSGSIRLDDLSAGFQAWVRHPLVGYGLSDTNSVTRYMSGFRSENLGFSNSFFDVLVRGGVVFMALFVVSLLGYLRTAGKLKNAGLLFVYLWVVTITTFHPVALLMFSIGVVGLLSPSIKGVRVANPMHYVSH
ncbi:O-antigen ligase family protein [Candidatus Collinsella stercoripullorum]|uniref:O-antigen ligase family protein n=1 Tax=Candidatus Collinsella stercoripullorum TaxID=2838522 RepID=UPI0022E4CDBB|nr:O-antigen ligase family protein [Candidatus Collinsella stercoripullorum]